MVKSNSNKMKKNIYRISLMALLAMLFISSCYKDKGEYFTSNWGSIDSISKLELPGAGSVFEGDQLVLDPHITYGEKVVQSDFDYYWIVGNDTISTQKKLDWTVDAVSGMSSEGEAFIYLVITSKDNGEEWIVYPSGNVNQPLTLKINLADAPQIGTIVYEKNDGTIEWASIKGTKQDFKDKSYSKLSLRTELYKKYNSAPLEGKVLSATNNDKDLIIYTDNNFDYGRFIRIVESKNSTPYYPFGKSHSTVNEEILSFAPAGGKYNLSSVNYFYSIFQTALLNNQFYITQASGEYPYIKLDPAGTGVVEDVTQVAFPVPATSSGGFFGLIRFNDNAVKMFKYTAAGIFSLASGPLKSIDIDDITGLFCQAPITNTYTTMGVFVVGKKGDNYKLYHYTVSSNATNTNTTFKSEIDITSWVDNNSIWFGTPSGTSGSILNPAFFTKGNALYRLNYNGFGAGPIKVSTFDAPVVDAIPVSSLYRDVDIPNSLYTMILTYDEAKGTSSCYLLDVHSGEVLTSFIGEIPGKAKKYLPRMIK